MNIVALSQQKAYNSFEFTYSMIMAPRAKNISIIIIIVEVTNKNHTIIQLHRRAPPNSAKIFFLWMDEWITCNLSLPES